MLLVRVRIGWQGTLAKDGAQNRTRLVLFGRLFGRVKESWMMDMGLGLIRGDF